MKKKIAAAVVSALGGLALAGSASALELYIDVQDDYDNVLGAPLGDADSLTTLFTQLNVQFNSISNLLAPVDLGASPAIGDLFTDEGWGWVNGFSGPNLDGTLSELAGTGAGFPQITFGFDNIQGIYADGGALGPVPAYFGGDISFYFDSSGGTVPALPGTQALYDENTYAPGTEDPFVDGLEILRISGISGGIGPGGLVLNGSVSFAEEDWWYTSLGDEWSSLLDQLVEIAFRVDFNDDQPNNVYSGCDDNDENCTLQRESNHNGSVNFAVPAPGVLALMGVGLLGMAGAARRKKAA